MVQPEPPLVADVTITSRVPPGRRVLGRRQLRLVVADSATRVARAMADQALRQWGTPQHMRSDVRLVLTELVSNVVRHAATPSGTVGVFDVVLDLLPASTVRVLVWDASSEAPVLRSIGEDAEGGRGLLLVNALSTCWGSYPVTAGGKAVWADISPVTDEPASPSNAPGRPSTRLIGRVLEGVREL